MGSLISNGDQIKTKGLNGNVMINIIRGPEPLRDVPDISLGAFLISRLQAHGNKVAQVHGITGEEVTYEDILTKSLSVAEALRLRGLKSGDVIAISSENNLEYCLAVLGIYFIGATCAPLNPLYTTRELLHSLYISKPSHVFCSELTAARLDEVSRQVDFLREIVVFGSSVAHNHTPFSVFLQNKYPDVTSHDQQSNENVAVILCSSGTTGLPKGVMLTGKNILASIEHLRDERFGAYQPDGIYLAILPFYHTFGFTNQIAIFSLGMKIILLPRFIDTAFLHAIQAYKVTLLSLVPPLILFLAKHPIVDQYDLSSVTDMWCAGAPLSPDVQADMPKRINIKHIRQGYGMTETTLAVLITPPDWNKIGSSGRLAPGLQCKVVNLTSGVPVGPHISGELCFKGPVLMKGYMDNPQATADCMDEDGFLHTGDIGYYDEDEFFFIVDRLKELIKYKGFQVPPAELEAILLTHPSIKDAAVIGIPDEAAGELPLAFVVLQPGQQLTKEEVMKFVSVQVSPQKRLHGGVRFVDVVPKSASGKILRRELRDVITAELKENSNRVL